MNKLATLLAARSTSARLALVVGGLFLISYLLLGTVLYFAVSVIFAQDLREVIRLDSADLVELYRESGYNGLRTEISERTAAPDDESAVYELITASGTLVAGQFASLPATAKTGSGWVEFDEVNAQGRVRVVARLQQLKDGSILLTGRRSHNQARFESLMRRTSAYALLAAAFLGGLIGWITAKLVARRLESTYDITHRVGAGELALRIPEDDSGDSFDRLAKRINAMLDRIQELLDGVRHATDHIAHDLRTPLTRLRNRLEDMSARHNRQDRFAAELEEATAETDQLLSTFSALLRLTRIEAQTAQADDPEFALEPVVQDAAELYAPIATQRGIELDMHTAGCNLRGDADQLFQLVANLLDNALKYATRGTRVILILAVDAQAVLIVVGDHGAGIPEADRERVFDRFVRLEKHRGSAGSGLGLSLVRAIAQRHGGTVTLEDNQPGLRVIVRLPLVAQG
ncbi:MAG: HAMP domain-containing histidine kinase [Proteobacteria bacterium]|nr:HAMP domain-containing histidine kinase [Pseudomonadota bacterium]